MAPKPHGRINKTTPPPNTVQVTMDRTNIPPTPDQALWVVIRNSANALGYQNYANFIDPIMAGRGGKALALPTPRASKEFSRINQRVQLTFQDAEPYRLLKVATEVFMMANAGVSIGPGGQPVSSGQLQPGGGDYATDLQGPNFPGIDMYDEELRILQSFTPADLQNEWSSYLQPLTTTPASGPPKTIETIPYLYDIVQFKLNGVPIRPGNEAYAASSAFYGILQQEADPALPARADLELLARGRHAGPDDERDELAVPEPARPAGPRSAGHGGDRPAARPQQPALGLGAGRRAPAHHPPPGLRVRPRVRPQAARQGRPARSRAPIRALGSWRASTRC